MHKRLYRDTPKKIDENLFRCREQCELVFEILDKPAVGFHSPPRPIFPCFFYPANTCSPASGFVMERPECRAAEELGGDFCTDGRISEEQQRASSETQLRRWVRSKGGKTRRRKKREYHETVFPIKQDRGEGGERNKKMILRVLVTEVDLLQLRTFCPTISVLR